MNVNQYKGNHCLLGFKMSVICLYRLKSSTKKNYCSVDNCQFHSPHPQAKKMSCVYFILYTLYSLYIYFISLPCRNYVRFIFPYLQQVVVNLVRISDGLLSPKELKAKGYRKLANFLFSRVDHALTVSRLMNDFCATFPNKCCYVKIIFRVKDYCQINLGNAKYWLLTLEKS